MNEQFITEILNKLRDRELHEYRVTNEHFLAFRKVLVDRADFKHFRGIALHGGEVIYTYLEQPRS
jgi:hypothetical protein